MCRIRCVRTFTQIVPALLRDVDAIAICRQLDVGKGQIAVRVRHILDLIEARQHMLDMRGIGQRHFARVATEEAGIPAYRPVQCKNAVQSTR